MDSRSVRTRDNSLMAINMLLHLVLLQHLVVMGYLRFRHQEYLHPCNENQMKPCQSDLPFLIRDLAVPTHGVLQPIPTAIAITTACTALTPRHR